MNRWRPIKTAPRDGTWVLVHSTAWKLPAIACWSYLSYCWQDMDRKVEPTHWLPIPTRPLPLTPREAEIVECGETPGRCTCGFHTTSVE